MKVRYHPDARAELLATVEWYEDRQSKLGEAFLSEVRRAEAMTKTDEDRQPSTTQLAVDKHYRDYLV